MSTVEVNDTKNELVQWIQSLTDESVLGLLHSIKLSNQDNTTDWWTELTEYDRLNILSGIKDYQKGETMESKEFWNRFTNE